jgi:hypothetical protein
MEEAHSTYLLGTISLVVEGLKRAKVKPLNYSQVTTVQQDPDKSLSTFLQCLKNAIQKHTTVDSESQVEEVLLKGTFLTQLTPDIYKTFQKVVGEGERSLDQQVQVSPSVYYNQDLTKKRDKDKKKLEHYCCTQVPYLMGPHSQDMLPIWKRRTLLKRVSKRDTAQKTALTSSGNMLHM